MKKIPNWYVITGGPDSGKTTVIKHLSELGYYTVPEYARLFIDKELENGKTLEEIRGDEIKFHIRVVKFKLSLERKTPRNKIVFFDRGLPDSIAYYKFLNVKPSQLIIKMSKNRYKKVFLLDALSYKNDYARNESEKDAQRIHELIKQTYKEFVYEIVTVPVMAIKKRVELILQNIM